MGNFSNELGCDAMAYASCQFLAHLIIERDYIMKRLLITTAIALFAHGAMAGANPDMRPFPKWLGVVKAAHAAPSSGTLKDKALLDAVAKQHSYYMTHYKYQDDPSDHWKTLAEFVKDKGGDCEDFAIAEYFYAVQLGGDESAMNVVIGEYVPRSQVHAALRVNVNGVNWYFDTFTVVPVAEVDYLKTFKPLYNINRLGWVDLQK